MHRQWQPYPNHPHVRALTERIDRFLNQLGDALTATDWATLAALAADRRVAEAELAKVTEALIRDPNLTPRWVAYSEADAEHGAAPCCECGNKISATENACSYCGWTYLVESAGTESHA